MRTKLINLFLSLFFFLLISLFLYLPSKQSEVKATREQKCSLVYVIGCEIYYCFFGRFNNYSCEPCGSTPC